ncbi:MAG: hypothetical protein KBT08_02965 [Bacteroidales bacterium]|nr:hypothetical protein [Candidatus Cryptobacteroides onthequi]
MRKPFALYLFLQVLLVSCNSSGIIEGADITCIHPGKGLCIDKDSSFIADFCEITDCRDIHIIDDTLFVIQDDVPDRSSRCFKVFSSKTMSYLGQFISTGRGPNEMISPYLIHNNSSDNCLLVRDNSSGSCYSARIGISTDDDPLLGMTRLITLDNSIDVIPITRNGLLSLRYLDNKCFYEWTDSLGCAGRKYEIIKDLQPSAVTYFSNLVTNNIFKGVVASVMLFLPQINIISESGTIRSIAVDKRYQKWSSLFSERLSPETVQYYDGLSSDKKYLYATYVCQPLKSINSNVEGVQIHIFDWDGNFVLNLSVKEDLGHIAIDSDSNFLYGLTRSSHSIVRYDLNGIL